MKFLMSLFSESKNVSSMRFVYIIVALTTCFISIWVVVARMPTAVDITLITSLLSIISVTKYKQKQVEKEKK